MQKINGNLWMPISDRNEVEPQNGYDVITSIDIDLQDVAHSALRRQLAKHEAHHGTAVLMEVKTGDVKAIANLERNEDGRYREVYNYAIGESSEPGSTFKLPVIMAAMEDGYININDSVDTGNGRIRYYDKIVKDEKEGGYGKLTVREVIEFSSNVGISKIITDCYTGREHEFIDRLYGMRLNEKLDVEIKGEGVPHIKYPKDKYWSGISLPMISHGYEVTMTPLQILTFYNAVANDGKMVKPRFVKELRQNGRIIKHFGVDVLNPTICSASTIRKAQQMLEGVVERGTARNLKNANFRIAGKTGTAQIANEKYGYKIGSKVSYQASFVGYFPADNPKYSCIVIINSPSRNVYYGNLVAGPVFKEIANKVYATGFESHDEFLVRTDTLIDPPYSKCGYMPELDQVFAEFNIPVKKDEPAQNWVLTYKRDSLVALKNHEIVPRLVPNVKDMGAKDAVYLLENAGLKVKIVGRGKVMSQSLRPGSRIHKGQKIVLTMSFT
jgi:cell division protein FtsI (penicillin-binding protein 3)